jgi:hypothetical protein
MIKCMQVAGSYSLITHIEKNMVGFGNGSLGFGFGLPLHWNNKMMIWKAE